MNDRHLARATDPGTEPGLRPSRPTIFSQDFKSRALAPLRGMSTTIEDLKQVAEEILAPMLHILLPEDVPRYQEAVAIRLQRLLEENGIDPTEES